jgi:hypothetical protein
VSAELLAQWSEARLTALEGSKLGERCGAHNIEGPIDRAVKQLTALMCAAAYLEISDGPNRTIGTQHC